METPASETTVRIMSRFAAAVGIAALGVASAVVAGWAFDLPAITHVLHGNVAMNPATATALALAAMSLLLLRPEDATRRRRRLGVALAAAAGAIALVRLAEYLLGVGVQIDRILFRGVVGQNRMAPNTALAIALLSTALVAIDVRLGRRVWISQVLALGTALIAFMALLGYLYGAKELYTVGNFIGMAVHTAGSLFALALGLLCARPRRGVMATLSGTGAGGILARRMGLAVVAVPTILGWLKLHGQMAGQFSNEYGAALQAAAVTTICLTLVLLSSVVLDRIDVRRSHSEGRFRHLLEAAPDAFVIVNRQGIILLVNAQTEILLGYPRQELLGRPIELLIPQRLRERHVVHRDGFFVNPHARPMGAGLNLVALCKDGRELPVEICLGPMETEEGVLVSAAIRDISRRREAENQVRRLNQELEQRVLERTAELDASNRALAAEIDEHQQARQQVETLNAELGSRVSQLDLTNRELAQKSHENETFVYSVSHDLRSPLVNLQGFSRELAVVSGDLRSLLLDGVVDEDTRRKGLHLIDEDMKESVHFIQTAVSRLGRIIDALLQLSRAGRLEYQWQQVDPNPIVARVVEALNVTISERSAKLVVRELPMLWGDPNAIEQVLANLIGNAVNYLDPQRPGTVEIGAVEETSAGAAQPKRTLYVRDNGRGMSPDQQAKVFQAFKRFHPDAAPGEGMGLAIVRRVVERHSGNIWLESEFGAGTTFYVSFPARTETANSATLHTPALTERMENHGDYSLSGVAG